MNDHSSSVLVVDDEQFLRKLLQIALEHDGFSVLSAADGLTALDLARQHRPEVVVLDLMLSGLDGLEVCQRLRTFSDAYVIMLTAKAEEIDRIMCLEVGADDYLTKPFTPRELLARVRALLRRPRQGGSATSIDVPPTQHFGDLVIDHGRREVTRGAVAIALLPLEFKLLTTLAEHPGLVFTRAELLEQVWGANSLGDDHAVDVHIANLRKKLSSDDFTPSLIETVCGVGYRFVGRPA